MEDKKEVKVEGKSKKSKVMTVFLGVALFCVFSLLLLVIFDKGELFGGTKCDVPKEVDCSKEEKPTEENEIINSISSYGYALYMTDSGLYLSVSSDEDNKQKEYVIGDRYVKAYKINGDSYSDIDYVFQGNGGNGLFLFFESNGEADKSETENISYKLSFINLDNFDANEPITPKTNDKLKNVSYVYKECARGGCSAIAVTKTGEKIDLYDITK